MMYLTIVKVTCCSYRGILNVSKPDETFPILQCAKHFQVAITLFVVMACTASMPNIAWNALKMWCKSCLNSINKADVTEGDISLWINHTDSLLHFDLVVYAFFVTVYLTHIEPVRSF
jgi:hypothetical protein